jgi:beta-1,4-mannosyltransferase
VLAHLAHGTIVHGAAARTRLAGAAGISEREVHVVPHGNYIGYYPDGITRETSRARLGIGEREVAFLLFGWVRRYKGVLELIRAFRSLAAEDARLVIAGKGREPEFEHEVRREAAGDPRILLHLETIPDADVQLYMHAADVAVFPYSAVLTSGAVVLAHSFGKACLVARNSGVDDMTGAEGTFVAESAGEEDLRRALAHAIRNRERFAQMGACNRAHAEAQGWERVAKATVDVYEAIL